MVGSGFIFFKGAANRGERTDGADGNDFSLLLLLLQIPTRVFFRGEGEGDASFPFLPSLAGKFIYLSQPPDEDDEAGNETGSNGSRGGSGRKDRACVRSFFSVSPISVSGNGLTTSGGPLEERKRRRDGGELTAIHPK